MKSNRITALLGLVAFSGAVHAGAGTESCAAEWTTSSAKFESRIQYDDLQTKANPTVHVFINGKAAKMILDTGANVHALWDTSLIDRTLDEQSRIVHTHVASAEGQRADALLGDERGNVSSQSFYIVPASVLSKDGYAGLLSPQTVAADDAVTIDFEKNCFFISSAFDIGADERVEVRRGGVIANPYRVMTIPVDLGGAKIPLMVDTGASATSILASLVASRPMGKKSAKTMDLFGSVVTGGQRTRLVDLAINGQTFKSHPVVPQPTINEQGVVDFGLIGMDILKDRVIYYDGTRQEFTLVTRKSAAGRMKATR